MQSHNDLAEFGQVTGGIVNIATKGGTNNIHGTAWEYIRNSAFDARDYFLTQVTRCGRISSAQMRAAR